MNIQKDIMVTIVVCTYNQEHWIRQTLDSILSQQTIYSYEVIIGEDYGTDGTRAICQEYADKFKEITLLPSTRNLGVTANWIRCVQAGAGKYIMGCAGDDWWHNPNKVQMQVDYMETHPLCAICHTDIDEYNEYTGSTRRSVKSLQGVVPAEGFVQKEVFNGQAHISAVTCCYRRSIFEAHVPTDEYMKLGLLGEDFPTCVIMAGYGEVKYIPESTATYRVGQPSITRRSGYEWIKRRYAKEKLQAQWLMKMFPNLGLYTKKNAEYFDNYCSHQLVLAAYRNNDYKSAHRFAIEDKMPNWKTKMAYTWLTFQIVRFIKQ